MSDTSFDFGQNDPRVKRAKKSHKPVDWRKHHRARWAERQVAKKLGGTRLPPNNPLDVVKGRIGIEVKAIIDSENNRVNVHSVSLAEKKKHAEELGLERLVMVAIDTRDTPYRILYRDGVGSFSLNTFSVAKNWNELKSILEE